MSKKRMSALDGAKRKGYMARAEGLPKKENPYQWNGHLYGYERGPRTWGTLFSDAWFEGWYECAAGRELTSFDGLGILKEHLDKFGGD